MISKVPERPGIRRAALAALLGASLASCGGGGGGSSVVGATMTVSPQSITVSAHAPQAAPEAALTIDVTPGSSQQDQFHLETKNTSSGISVVSYSPSTGQVDVAFKDPGTLALGTYTDTVTIIVCSDNACQHPISNSPQVIPVSYTVGMAVPTIEGQFTPQYALVGSAGFTLYVYGQEFTAASVVQWAGTPLATTFGGNGALSATVPASDLTTAGNFAITVANGAVVSAPVQFPVDTVAPPTIAYISPTVADVDGPALTLTVYGINFLPQSIVQWAGSALVTTYVSSSELTAVVPASDLSSVGQIAVTVSTEGEVAPAAQFTVQNVQTPLISQLSPSSATADAAAFVLSVTGTNFARESVVNWGGSARTTTYLSPTQLSAQINAADVAAAGSVPVTVQTQSTVSQPIAFAVNALPVFSVSSVTPTTVAAGGPAFMLSVNGAGFTATTTVQWNGSQRTPTYVSTNLIRAQILASDIASTATNTIVVTNPANVGGGTATAQISVVPASLDAVSAQINPSHNGAIAFNALSFPASSLWSVNLGGYASVPLIGDGLVFVTVTSTDNGPGAKLYALSQATGATVWGPVQLASQPSLAYEGGKLFAFSVTLTGSGTLQAFNATSGAVLWTQSFTGAVFGNPGVIAANGLAYIASEGTLFAVNESSGAVAWSAPINGGDSGTPAVTADGVYLIYPCQSYDFDPPSGTVVWQDETPNCGGAGGYTAQVANGQMYLPYPASGNSNGQLFNAETGVADGSFASGSGVFPVVSATSSYYFSARQELTDVQLSNGATLWAFSGDGSLNTSPLVVNNYVLIGSGQGNVYALDAATGAQVWQANVGSTITGGPSPGALNLPFYGMGAGDGLLVVPSGTSVTAYLLSSNP